MTRILVIPDGVGAAALQEAHTPVLDRLRAEGAARLVATTPAGLAPGSDAGIPTLLGAPPAAPLCRGALEAAGSGIDVPAGARAWRVDLRRPDGERADEREVACALPAIRLLCSGHDVRALRGHRLLLIGATRPAPVAPGLRATVWPAGALPDRVLDDRTVVVAAPGTAAGVARLLGARVVTPTGATGDVDTDLRAKAAAALAAGDAETVVVHVGAPDEAAHRRDRAGHVRAIERIDAELLAPLAAGHDGPLAVCPDHGTDPATGAHDAAPVPAVVARCDREWVLA